MSPVPAWACASSGHVVFGCVGLGTIALVVGYLLLWLLWRMAGRGVTVRHIGWRSPLPRARARRRVRGTAS